MRKHRLLRECAQKLQQRKKEHISRTSSYCNKFNIRKDNQIMKKQAITVFTAKKARQLLKEGFTIVDIKPDRMDKDHKRTLFIFKNEDGLMEKIIE